MPVMFDTSIYISALRLGDVELLEALAHGELAGTDHAAKTVADVSGSSAAFGFAGFGHGGVDVLNRLYIKFVWTAKSPIPSPPLEYQGRGT